MEGAIHTEPAVLDRAHHESFFPNFVKLPRLANQRIRPFRIAVVDCLFYSPQQGLARDVSLIDAVFACAAAVHKAARAAQ